MPTIDQQTFDYSSPESLLIDLLPLIPKAVRKVCCIYRHYPSQDTMNDLTQSIILLLIDEDYRRLRTFDNQRSPLNIWLQAVINHYVSRFLKRQKGIVNLEDVVVDTFVCQPRQEVESLLEEWRHIVDEVVGRLTERERNLFELLCLGTPVKEIAELMRIKPDSVHRGKHALIKKLRRLVEPLR